MSRIDNEIWTLKAAIAADHNFLRVSGSPSLRMLATTKRDRHEYYLSVWDFKWPRETHKAPSVKNRDFSSFLLNVSYRGSVLQCLIMEQILMAEFSGFILGRFFK